MGTILFFWQKRLSDNDDRAVERPVRARFPAVATASSGRPTPPAASPHRPRIGP